jgi:serine/threonine-protein kinase
VENKRKGSDPPRTSGPLPDEPGSFAFTDDDESPLPAPPPFDGRRGGVPELLESDEVIETVDEAELLDSSLVTEVRPTHAMPPPIPAPVPTGPGRRAMFDDGEIALPPRISQLSQSQRFPFREIHAEESGAYEPPDPDEPGGETSGWRSPAPRGSEATQVLDPDELMEATLAPPPPPRAPPPRPPAAMGEDFVSLTEGLIADDEPSSSMSMARRAPPSTPPAAAAPPSTPPAPAAPEPRPPARSGATGTRWSFADLDEPPTPPAWEDEPVPTDRFSAPSPATTPPFEDPTRMFADGDDDRAAETVVDGPVASGDDATGLFSTRTENGSTGLFTHRPPGEDDHTGLYALRDDAPAPATGEIVDSPDEDAPASPAPAGAATSSGAWARPRPPQPSAAIPVAAFDDDDDDWSPAASRAPATSPPVDVNPSSAISVADIPEDDDEPWTPQTAARGTNLSGAIPVADLPDDDDDAWTAPTQVGPAPSRPPTPAPPSRPPTPASRADDDDEWEPQVAAAHLAPAPNDLAEPFPLDLWSDPDELVGRELGGYRLVAPITRGMTTRAYAGEATADGRPVVVRVLAPNFSPAEPRARQFLYEAQQLAKLRGEHIAEVLATGTTPDHLTYYVTERVDGETLASVVRTEGPLPWYEVAAFAHQICEALLQAKSRGIVHGDLTAASCVRVRAPAPATDEDAERPRGRIKLLGVGVTPLASVFRGAEGGATLSPGTPPGTAEYMAPEIAGGGRPDEATEIYALGVLMYELLTGRPPFRGDSFIAVLKKQMYDDPPSPRMVVPEQEIPEMFEAIVLKALAKAPGERHEGLRALDDALLAARAREGELRRVTQILALDPAFWDEDGSRRAVPSGAAAAEPAPLATFTADLQKQQPDLAARVFSRPGPRNEPSAALQLTQLAAPVTAPALPPVPAAAPPQMPVIVLSQPPTGAAGPNLVRTISIAVIIGSLLLFLALWMRDQNGRGAPRKPGEVSAEAKRPPATKPKKKTEPRPKTETPADVDTPAPPTPAPPPETPPAVDPEPVPKDSPPPAPEPAPKDSPPPATAPTDPPPVAAVPTPSKPPPVKKDPAPKKDPFDDRPEKIDGGRLKSRLDSMEPRVVQRCAGKVSNAKGVKVTVKVTVDARGNVSAPAQGAWADQPLGRCVQETIESLHFNESRLGGSRVHTFSF